MLIINYLLLCYCGIAAAQRPNFVIVLTDDQDVVLDGMTPMTNVHRFIGQEGVTFTNSFTTSPICCPSRASLLTGLYLHNHGTRNNSATGGCYSARWQNKHEPNTFANLLHRNGYTTFYAGKYLNQYGEKETGGPEKVPPGWTEWHGLVGNSVYYDYTISNNGVPTHSTKEYLTDVIRDVSVSYIENQTESQPFLMVLAPPAPHAPFTPAPRHQGAYGNVTALRHPNFNLAVHDKHWLIRMPPSPLPDAVLPHLDQVYRSRWETLLAVDEMVADVVGALETQGLLDNTYLVYTSDNGYHIGQFSQAYDKRQPYESDIRVPLIIKGPKIPKNVTSPQPVLNIDLAPTILELAGVEVPKEMDGRAVRWGEGSMGERNMLIEYYGEGSGNTVDDGCPWKYDSERLAFCNPEYECKCQDSRNNTYACIRHQAERIDRKYCVFIDDENYVEMYDLSKDPFELKNIISEVFPAVKHWYKLTLAQMLACSGATSCDNPFGNEVQGVEEPIDIQNKKGVRIKKRKCPFWYNRF